MYVTYSDCVARYPALKQWHDENETMVNSYLIHHAEQEINGRLAPVYTVPFSDNVETVKDLCIDLVYLKGLYSRDYEAAELLEKAFNKRIERILDGKEAIITTTGVILDVDLEGLDIWSNTKDYHPVHSMLDADSPYTGIDSDLLDAEEDERS